MEEKTIKSLVDNHNNFAARMSNILAADKSTITCQYMIDFLHPLRFALSSSMDAIVNLLDKHNINYVISYSDYIIKLV